MNNGLHRILTFDDIKNDLFKLCEEMGCEINIDRSDNIIIHKHKKKRKIVKNLPILFQ